MQSIDSTVLQATASVCGTISVFATIYAIVDIAMKSHGENLSFTQEIMVVLLILNLGVGIGGAFGTVEDGSAGFCSFQGFMIQFNSFGTVLWLLKIVWDMYKWIVKKKRLDSLKARFKRDVISLSILTFVPSIVLLGMGYYTESGPWCWIGRDHSAARFACFYVPLVISYLGCLGVVSFIKYDMQRRKQGARLSVSEVMIVNQLSAIVVVYLFAYGFALMNRTLEWVTGNENGVFALVWLQSFFVTIQGFFNVLIYKGVVIYITQKTGLGMPDDYFQSDKDKPFRMLSASEIACCKEAIPFNEQDPGDMQDYSLFATTFNLGEAPTGKVLEHISDWLLHGHDLYCINVQECLEFEALKAAVHAYLGGNEKYFMIASAIGSDIKAAGYHGYIGIIVLIAQKYYESGAIRVTQSGETQIATGANLGFTTAENKGGVGIPVQVNELSIVFVGSHLPSDEKGTSKLLLRHKAGRHILREMCTTAENSGFSLENEHHLCFFMGDLNYRMEDDRRSENFNKTLIQVAAAAQVEWAKLNNSGDSIERSLGWLDRRYQLLRAPSDPSYPTQAERQKLLSSRSAAARPWEAVTEQADELLQAISLGQAFCCWEEYPLTFAPSYKRVIGQIKHPESGAVLGPPDYLDPGVSLYSYSNYEDIMALAKRGKASLGDFTRKSRSSSVKSESDTVPRRESRISEPGLSWKHSPSDGSRSESMSSALGVETSLDEVDGEEEDEGEDTFDGMAIERVVHQVPKKRPRSSRFAKRASKFFMNGLSEISGGAFGKGDDEEEKKAKAAKEWKDKLKAMLKKRRVPSYTDRILFHQQAELRGDSRLTLGAYDLANTMSCSDHKPVTLVATIRANKKILCPRHFVDKPNGEMFSSIRAEGDSVRESMSTYLQSNDVIPDDMSSEVMSVTKTPFADLPVNNEEQQAQTGDVEAPPVRVADMYSSRTSTSYGTRASEQTVQNAKIIVGSEYFLYELELHEFELVVELDKERKRNSEVDDGKHLSANVVKGNADPSRSGTSFLDEAEKGIVIDDGEDKEEEEEEEEEEKAIKQEKLLDIGYMTLALGLPSGNPLLQEQHNNSRMVDLFNIDDIAMTTLLQGDTAGLQTLYDSALGPSHRRQEASDKSDKGLPRSAGRPQKRRSTLNSMLTPLAGQSIGGDDDMYVVPHSLMKPSATLRMEKLAESSSATSPRRGTHYMNGTTSRTISKMSARSAKVVGNNYVPSAMQSLSGSPTSTAYGMTRGGLRMVGALVPSLGAHVVIKFHHDFVGEERIGECIVSLSHLLQRHKLDGPVNEAASEPVFIKDIPVSNGGLLLGKASGYFLLTFLGGCAKAP